MSVAEFTVEEDIQLETANAITSVVSILGSLFIIGCFLKLKELRSFAFRLVVMVSVSDVLFSLGNFLGDAGGNPETHLGANYGLCMVQSVLISIGGLSSLMWAVSIAFTLHMAFLREDAAFAPHRIQDMALKYHLVCWLFPVLMAVLPFFSDAYGDTGGWCWIKHSSGWWRFFQYYLWLWLGIAYNSYVFFNIYRKIKAMGEAAGNGSSMAARLRLYPIVLLVCQLPGTIATIYEVGSGGKMIFFLSMVQVIFGTSNGLWNALVYGLTPEVTRVLCDKGSNSESLYQEEQGLENPAAESDNANI
jgi:hypothetical protein